MAITSKAGREYNLGTAVDTGARTIFFIFKARRNEHIWPNGLVRRAAAFGGNYLLEVARSSKGGRYRKSTKIDALRNARKRSWKRTAWPQRGREK